MLKKITNNLGLKLLAFVFAVALWMIVVNVDDPEITRSFTVSVTLENTDILEDAGKCYEILDDSDSIRVTITAKRSIMENIDTSDFVATADFSDLDEDDLDGEHKIAITLSLNRYASQITLNSGTKYLEISVEDEASVELEVGIVTSGSAADGYSIGSVKTNPETITVTGPESEIENVAVASATVDVEGISSDKTYKVEPTLYDENGSKIDTTNLTISDTEITVTVSCQAQKSVTIEASTSGTPADGYEVYEVTMDVDSVDVQGDSDALAKCSTITIPSSKLDVDGLSEDLEVTVSLEDYLPDGVTLVSGEPTEVTITVNIIPYEEQSISYSTSDILLENLADGYVATISENSVSISVLGASDVISDLKTSDIEVSADLTDLTEGTHTVTLDITLPGGVTLSEDATVTVVISTSSTDTTEESDT